VPPAHFYFLLLERSRGVGESRRGVDGPIACSTRGIPNRGLTRSPVRGIFSNKRLLDIVDMQDAVRARDL
jgi:hypothetical protein